jgi:Flp pilus assembly protein TadG
MMMVWFIIILAALMALVSLGVDLGRVQLVKTELQAAADAAARYAATGLSDNTCLSKAQAVAAQNTCDGAAVSIQAADVVTGTWTSNVFTAGGSSPNAVRISLRRPVPLMFAKVLGFATCDVSAQAVCTVTSASSATHGFVGLDSISMNGNAEVDSYLSSSGTYSSSTRRTNGHVGTNQSVDLNGNVKIYGDAYYKTSYSANGNAQVVAPGQPKLLSGTLNHPSPSLPSSYTSMGNLNGGGNGSLSLNSGNYYFTSFNTSGNFTLLINGQVNVYVNGGVNLSGNHQTHNSLPGNFRIHVLSSGSVSIHGNANLYADVYAPNSAISISGNGDFYGRAIGKTLSVDGNGKLHFDESVGPPYGGGGGGATAVSTVQ